MVPLTRSIRQLQRVNARSYSEYRQLPAFALAVKGFQEGITRIPEAALVDEEQDDATVYKVVVNEEEQYSIWPSQQENAPGWRDAGKSGSRAECLAYIESVWTDMRPLSLRRRMGDTPPA